MSAVVVHLPPPMQKRAFCLMLARAKQLEEEGQEVVLTHCALPVGTCSGNLAGSRLVCKACHHSTRQSVADTGLTLVPLGVPPEQNAERPETLSFRDRCELAGGVQSCLVTVLRVLTADLNHIRVLRGIKRRYYNTAASLLRAFYRLLDDRDVDRIEVLNGRYACMKAGVVAAQSRGISFTTLDFNCYGQPMVFAGHTPHDRTAIQQRIRRNEPDQQLAHDYYDGRRDRRHNKFAAKHRHFHPPEVEDRYRRKVTFYLSSQDECESLGPSWRSPFRNNAEVIRQACEAFPDYYFCVRFHPNQANILSDVTRGFRGLQRLPNLSIYYPDDDVDSYSLLDWSDVVVTFASTVAIEACWQGKPVVQLGPSFFDQLNISETPRTVQEFLQLLGTELQPHDRDSAARFARYETSDFDSLRYLDCQNGKAKPVGFARRASAFAKSAKELNGMATKTLQRLTERQLQRRRKSA